MALSDDLLTEYAQAAANFRDGFSTIQTIIRSFVTLNGILLASFGLTQRFLEGQLQGAMSLSICGIGAAASVTTWIVHRRMTLYFRSWVKRAAEIENGTEMSLFSETARIEREARKNPFQTYAVANLTYLVVGMLWVSVLLV